MAFAMDEKQNIAFFTLTSEKVLTYKYKYPFFGCNPHQGSTFKKIKHITYLVDKDTDIKAEPTKNAGSIKQLGKGDILSFIEFGKYYEKDQMLSYSWVKVRAGDGTVGWSNAHFLTELRVEYEE